MLHAMLLLRLLALTLALACWRSVAMPFNMTRESSEIKTHGRPADMELRAISRMSLKRDDIDPIALKSSTLALDFVDGRLILDP